MGTLSSSVVNATPLDFLHGWCAGIAKTVISCVITVLLCLSGDFYADTFQCIQDRMANMPRFPVAPGFSKVLFKRGMFVLIGNLLVFNMYKQCI